MLKLEFHCHTHVSKDSLTNPVDLVSVARRKGVDRVVITDHNSIEGAREAQEIDPELIIIGEEIMTTKGEILAAFVREEISALLSPQETISQLKAQGAFISVSHPFDELRKGGWMENDLLEILPFVDAIEVFNSRCMLPRFNRRAELFAREHNIAGTVGSDAHAAFEVGRSLLLLDPFTGPEGLRNVIRGAKMKVKRSPWWFHLTSRYASMKKKIKS
jgi:predicted metal-dependent phosphoesterase TrpH